MAAGAGQVGSLHDTGRKDEPVVGAQGVGKWRQVAQQQVGNYRPAANQEAVEIVGRPLDVGFRRRQIYMQNFSVCATNHKLSLRTYFERSLHGRVGIDDTVAHGVIGHSGAVGTSG